MAMPWLVGLVADGVATGIRAGSTVWQAVLPTGLDPAQAGLRAGLLVAGACPLLLAVLVAGMRPTPPRQPITSCPRPTIAV